MPSFVPSRIPSPAPLRLAFGHSKKLGLPWGPGRCARNPTPCGQLLNFFQIEKAKIDSTISRTRRLIDLGTHRAVFGWVLGLLADRGLIQGKRVTLTSWLARASILR